MMVNKTKKQTKPTLVRSHVKALLTTSPAFHSLPAETQKKIAHDMVKVTSYLAVSDAGHSTDQTSADVNFPAFVSGLINGVFGAIVDSSIKQMDAYGKLMANVARSLDEFVNPMISDKEASAQLLKRLPDLSRDPGKTRPPRIRLASNRQTLLATMMLMGINRIVVTAGRTPAKQK